MQKALAGVQAVKPKPSPRDTAPQPANMTQQGQGDEEEEEDYSNMTTEEKLRAMEER